MARPGRFRVQWAETARADLQSIVEYIAEDDIHAARSVLAKLEQTAQALTTMPLRGRVVPELDAFGIHVYRELVVPPWRIVYRISAKTVRVLAVVDSRRNLEDLLLERFMRNP